MSGSYGEKAVALRPQKISQVAVALDIDLVVVELAILFRTVIAYVAAFDDKSLDRALDGNAPLLHIRCFQIGVREAFRVNRIDRKIISE